MSDSKRRKLPSWMQSKADASASNTGCDNQNKREKSVLNLPPLTFDGSIIYAYNPSDCALISEDLRETLDKSGEMVVGFDMEWPVTYQVGKEPKTAVIQICTQQMKCYIFHVSCMPDIPKPLKELITDERLKKAGIAIEGDFWKLDRDFDITATKGVRNSLINLTPVANEILKTKENWSLDGLCRHLIRKKLNKDASIRKSDWSKYPLTDEQKNYAAMDAYASLLLYEELMKLKKSKGI